jgi:hypothetical protein
MNVEVGGRRLVGNVRAIGRLDRIPRTISGGELVA